MPLTSSGQIDLNAMHVEAGGTSGTECTLNDADIRGLISKGAGAQNAFNEYYGASSSATPQNISSTSSINGTTINGFMAIYAHDNGDFQLHFRYDGLNYNTRAMSTNDGASWSTTAQTGPSGSNTTNVPLTVFTNASRTFLPFGSAGGLYAQYQSGKFSNMSFWLLTDNGHDLQIPNSQNYGVQTFQLGRDQNNKTGQIIAVGSSQNGWQWNGSYSSTAIASSNVTSFPMPSTSIGYAYSRPWKKGSNLFIVGRGGSNSIQDPIVSLYSSNSGSSYSATTIRTLNTSTEANQTLWIQGYAVDEANDDFYCLIRVTLNTGGSRDHLYKTTASNAGTSWTQVSSDMLGDCFGRTNTNDVGTVQDFDVYGGCFCIAWINVSGTSGNYSSGSPVYSLRDGGWGSSSWVNHLVTPSTRQTNQGIRKVAINSNKKAIALELHTLRRFY